MQILLPHHPGCQWERLTLLPADPEADGDALVKALARGGDNFVELLLHFDLAPLWHARMSSCGSWSSLPEAQRQRLQDARLAAAARYLYQQRAIAEVDQLFSSAAIPYAVMKGVLLREHLHVDPSVMTADDIDVLVSPSHRDQAACVLLGAGFKMHLEARNVSHEATFQAPTADIDLHWHMLKPGRTRIELTDELLSRRVRVNGFWGLSDSDSTFVMLTHPAFAKYVCSPNMGLGRVMAFLLWSRSAALHWPAVVQLLERTGLKAAAWAMLGWFIALAPATLQPTLAQWRDCVRPGPLRSRYLEFWLRHNLPSRLIDHPLSIQLGFTTFLHDRPSDALIAWRGWYSSRRHRQQDASALVAMQESLT